MLRIPEYGRSVCNVDVMSGVPGSTYVLRVKWYVTICLSGVEQAKFIWSGHSVLLKSALEAAKPGKVFPCFRK